MMNKKIFAFTVLFFSASLLFCSEKLHLTFTPKFNFITGELGEHLFTSIPTDPFRKNIPIEQNKTSLLEWKIGHLFSFGFDSDMLIGNRIYLDLSFSAGIPSYVGQMYDYDWFNHTNICQSRSISKEKINELYYTDFNFGFSFQTTPSLSLIPIVGFSYKYIDFFADDSKGHPNGLMDPDPGINKFGYYDTDNEIISYEDERAKEYEGTWITYWRNTYIIWIGINASYKLNEKISFNCNLKTSPYISATSEDHHPGIHEVLKTPCGDYYQDIVSGHFKAFQLNLTSDIKITELISVSLKIDAFYLRLITGPTYSSGNPGKLGSNESGSYAGDTQKDLTFGIGFKINLF